MIHPNVHEPWARWSEEQTLHIACAYSNPFRWRSRRELMNDFKRSMMSVPNVTLHAGELAYGDRPFEVTGEDPGDVQLRCRSEMFHKENILNLIVQRFPADWRYGAWIDADFTFTRYDWALEAVHQLQHHEFVQLFSTYATLSPAGYGGHCPDQIRRGFVASYIDNGYEVPKNWPVNGWPAPGGDPPGSGWAPSEGRAELAARPAYVPVGATGGAWAFRRSAFDAVGGLLDQCILGHADWFMAFGLVYQPASNMHATDYHPHYTAAITGWQKKAARLRRNIGVVDQFAVHHFHGSYRRRQYETRDLILVRHRFDPVDDLARNSQGVYELTESKPDLRDDIRRYFIERAEDNPERG